ncbi:MAG: hypothetical protein AB1758_22130, partial [Candidatus Eremiobacterota bacterium]
MRTLLVLLLTLLAGPAAAELRVSWPPGEVWLQPGESFFVEVLADPGEAVRLEPERGPAVGLSEGPPGRFSARVSASGRLILKQGQSTLALPPVKTLGPRLPVARVVRPDAILRSAPDEGFDRLDPLPAGLCCPITGRQGEWLRLWPDAGWVNVADVRIGNFPASSPRLSSVRVTEPGDGSAEVRLRLNDLAAWQVESPQENRLRLLLPGTPLSMGEVAYAGQPRVVQSIQLYPGPERTAVELQLGEPGLWGYGLRWEAPDLVLELSPPPSLNPDRPLEGVRVVLDPGHGGEDLGAVGVGGLKE